MTIELFIGSSGAMCGVRVKVSPVAIMWFESGCDPLA
jgi:hypothetical protein